ncbi:butyrate kinase [Dysgonomonas massiliensis]|uniref:butyrate kinase n=1 Tax=Dysgonomonas massiliensis TaxID=2040292 RepID=UPI000C794C6B|nr:butyrate kinase [Dysgonomonas massiliensis]
MKRILAINPGSTSTKIAVFKENKNIFKTSIRHSAEELSKYKNTIDQYPFRKELILEELKKNNIDFEFHAVIGRGGLLKPIPGGVYEVNEQMIDDVKNNSKDHASNLGCLLAADIASMLPGCKALIADPVVVDELKDIARISGLPEIPRVSIFHALNQKAIARRYAREVGKVYEESRLIVCHMGGGISTGVHLDGKVVDVNNGLDGEGPFSPERSGSLPSGSLIDMCFSGEYTLEDMKKKIVGNGGLVAHLGSNNLLEIMRRVEEGDKHAELIVNAMIYNIAKRIGSAAVVLKGRIDAIILTGGLAYSDYVVLHLKDHISFLGPVRVYPGEDEMEALATNALSALNGILPIKCYC